MLLRHKLAVLRLHDFPANSVCGHVLGHKVLSVGRIEISLLIPRVNGRLPLTHFLHHLSLDLSLHLLSLAADAGHPVGLVLTRAILSVVRREQLLVRLTVDPIGRVVEHFALNRILKVMVPLRNVSLRYSPSRIITDNKSELVIIA